MKVHNTLQEFEEVFKNAVEGSFTVNGVSYSLVKLQEEANLDHYKKLYEVSIDKTEYKYKVCDDPINQNADEVCVSWGMMFDLFIDKFRCDECSKLGGIYYNQDRPIIDSDQMVSVAIICKSCGHVHSTKGFCFCKKCKAKENKARKLAKEEENRKLQLKYALKDLYEFYTYHQDSISIKASEPNLNSDLWDLLKIDSILSKKINYEESIIGLLRFTKNGLIKFTKMSFEEFEQKMLTKYNLNSENIQPILKKVRYDRNNYFPKLFLFLLKMDYERVKNVGEYVEEGNFNFDTNRKYLDSDFIDFANAIAHKHNLELNPKHETINNILELNKFMSELEIFKVIEMAIGRAVNYGVLNDMNRLLKRNTAISFLNEARNKYDPNGSYKWKVYSPMPEWELEEKWDIFSIGKTMENGVSELKSKLVHAKRLDLYFSNMFY